MKRIVPMFVAICALAFASFATPSASTAKACTHDCAPVCCPADCTCCTGGACACSNEQCACCHKGKCKPTACENACGK